jgi:hypothetical protein
MSDLIRDRAAAKVRARERDEERLRRGEVSPHELQRENLVSADSGKTSSDSDPNTGRNPPHT